MKDSKEKLVKALLEERKQFMEIAKVAFTWFDQLITLAESTGFPEKQPKQWGDLNALRHSFLVVVENLDHPMEKELDKRRLSDG